MDAKSIANAAYVLQRAEAKLISVTEAKDKAIEAAVTKARDAATKKHSDKLAAAQAKVVEAKAALQKLTNQA